MNRILSLIGVVLVVGCGGPRDGPCETYYEGGQLRTKGTYKDNEKCGEWFEWGETVTYDPC